MNYSIKPQLKVRILFIWNCKRVWSFSEFENISPRAFAYWRYPIDMIDSSSTHINRSNNTGHLFLFPHIFIREQRTASSEQRAVTCKLNIYLNLPFQIYIWRKVWQSFIVYHLFYSYLFRLLHYAIFFIHIIMLYWWKFRFKFSIC